MIEVGSIVQTGFDPIAEVRDLRLELEKAFPLCRQPARRFPASHRFHHAVAGLTMAADWMGSDTRWHPVPGPDNRPWDTKRLLDDTRWCGWLIWPRCCSSGG